jgi:tRNA-dihydrouridine synthase B
METDCGNTYLKSLGIGSLVTRHNILLAPLAGISDYPFRRMCREFGANLTYTEMVSADGLIYRNSSTMEILKTHPDEEPIGIQLFGSDPEVFKQVMPLLEELKPALIDINFGCPVRKVVARGAGAALLQDLEKMRRIVGIVKRNTVLPVTAKIRLGWDNTSIVVEEAAQTIEAAGADAVTVHARTRRQGYSGKASWESIARVKEILNIPVIGNGDVTDGVSALEMFRSTGVDGIMIARGALGRPWIFRQILSYLENGTRLEDPSFSERMEIMMYHFKLAAEKTGENRALKGMRKHLVWYTRGLPDSSNLRRNIFQAGNMTDIEKIFREYARSNHEKERVLSV